MVHKNEMEKYMNPENRPIRSIFTVMSTAIRTLEKEGRLTMEKRLYTARLDICL